MDYLGKEIKKTGFWIDVTSSTAVNYLTLYSDKVAASGQAQWLVAGHGKNGNRVYSVRKM